MIQPPPATDPRIVALVTATQGGPAAGLSLAALNVVYNTTGSDGVVAAPAGTIELVGGPGIVETLVAAGLLVSDGDRLRVPGGDVARGSAESLPEAVREECVRLAERDRKKKYRQSEPGTKAKPKAAPTTEKGGRKYIEYGPLPMSICGVYVTLHKNQEKDNYFAQMLIEGGRIQAPVDDLRPGDLRGVAEKLLSMAFLKSKKGRISPSAEAIKTSTKAIPATPKGTPCVASWGIYGEAIREGRDHVPECPGMSRTVRDIVPDIAKTEVGGPEEKKYISRENGHFSGSDEPQEMSGTMSGTSPLIKKEESKEYSLSSEEGAPEGIRVDPGEPIRPPRAAGPADRKAMIAEELNAAGIPGQHRKVAAMAVVSRVSGKPEWLSRHGMPKDLARECDAAVADGLLDFETVSTGLNDKGESIRSPSNYVLMEKLLAVVEAVRERIAAGDDVPVVVE